MGKKDLHKSEEGMNLRNDKVINASPAVSKSNQAQSVSTLPSLTEAASAPLQSSSQSAFTSTNNVLGTQQPFDVTLPTNTEIQRPRISTMSNENRQVNTSSVNNDMQSNSNPHQTSPLARATATHMRMTAELMDNVDNLTCITNRLVDRATTSVCDFRVDAKDITSKIPHCAGDDPIKLIEFIQEVEAVVNLQLASEIMLMKSLLNYVHNDLRIWWASALQQFNNWHSLKISLISQFISPVGKQQLINKLVRRTQGINESFRNFINDIHTKAIALNVDISENELVLQIWANANYNTLLELRDKEIPTTIAQLQVTARRIEQNQVLLQAAKQREESSSLNRNNTCNQPNTSKAYKNSKN